MNGCTMSIRYNLRTSLDFVLVCIGPCPSGICTKMLLQSVNANYCILEKRVHYLYL